MTISTYKKLSKDLQTLSKTTPLFWGKIQNNATDSQADMFACNTIEALENAIASLSETDKNYFRRRWFIWMCSKVDEYLFYTLNNVEQNPMKRDKTWDISFNHHYKFDVKGTVVPQLLSNNFNIEDEEKLINFYYENQSKGVRFGLQNRLFIVHHSYKNKARSKYLRCHWQLKTKAYKTFAERVTNNTISFYKYEDAISKCIFILEDEHNNFYFKIN